MKWYMTFKAVIESRKTITNWKHKRIDFLSISLHICRNPCHRLWRFLKLSSRSGAFHSSKLFR
jgi:hypothetical protein